MLVSKKALAALATQVDDLQRTQDRISRRCDYMMSDRYLSDLIRDLVNRLFSPADVHSARAAAEGVNRETAKLRNFMESYTYGPGWVIPAVVEKLRDAAQRGTNALTPGTHVAYWPDLSRYGSLPRWRGRVIPLPVGAHTCGTRGPLIWVMRDSDSAIRGCYAHNLVRV